MKRSISMPVKPYAEPPKTLKRSNETEKLFSTTDQIEIIDKSNDLINKTDNNCNNSSSIVDDDDHNDNDDDHFDDDHFNNETDNNSTEDQLSSLVDIRHLRRRTSTWFGTSTIEIATTEYSDDENADDLNTKKNNNKKNVDVEYNPSRRLIAKNGHQNVTFKKVPKRSLRYCKDIVTTLIEQEWGYTLTLFAATFFLSWFIFACLWYLIAQAHGDLDIDIVTKNRLSGDGKQPCVVGAFDFTGMFIHSLELQSTIGFGEKYPTEECPEGVFLFVMQIIISIGIEGAIVAVVYAKMAKPVKQISKLTFSKTACVHLRDGKLCLVFRVCDPREQKSILTMIRVYLVMDIETSEGEALKVNKELQIEGNGTGLIMWPETICHVINEMSPFYEFTEQHFNTKNYEIFVSLVGHSPTTGQQTESRTSYLRKEVSWGQRFTNVIIYDHIKDTYIINYDNFHTTFAVDTPIKSAYHHQQMKRIEKL